MEVVSAIDCRALLVSQDEVVEMGLKPTYLALCVKVEFS
jgi:hypothetical protein